MKKVNIIIFIVIFALITWPFLVRGGLYYVGGDDMRLYYVFPEKYLENFSFNLITGNTLAGAQTGYAPVAYFAPIFYFILFLKTLVPVNVQSLMFGINLSMGFLFFYLLLKEITSPKKLNEYLVIIVSALFYIFSPFLIQTLLKHQMLTQYLISIMPAVFYFFYLSVKKEKVYYALVSVLIFSVFSSTLNTMPWSLGFVLGTIPFWMYLFFVNKIAFIKSFVISAISFTALNIYWIFHLIYPYLFTAGSALNYYSSPEFHVDNLRIIQGVSRLYRPSDILFMNADRLIANPFIEYLKVLFIITVIVGGILIFITKHKYRDIYVVGLFSFLTSWYLFSPNLGEWGPALFIKMVGNVPFFTMFRNMQDKFALPLTFNFAFLFALALIVFTKYSRKATVFLSIVSLVALFSNSPSFFYSLDDDKKRYFSGEFEGSFVDLLESLDKTEDDSRVVWLPLNFPTYVNVNDAHGESRIYSGLSPVRALIGKDDYTGTFSFMTESSLFYGYEIFDLIEEEQYEEVGKYFQQFNARYVVVRDEELPMEMEKFMYGGEGLPLLNIQDDQFINNYTGDMVDDLGKYKLYKINEDYDSRRLFLTSSIAEPFNSINAIEYEKVREGEYFIRTPSEQDEINLILLDPYSEYWNISAVINNEQIPVEFTNNKIEPLGNAFNIRLPEQSDEIQLRIFFRPLVYNFYLFLISITSAVITSMFVILKIANIKSR